MEAFFGKMSSPKKIDLFKKELRNLLIKDLSKPFEILKQYKEKELRRIEERDISEDTDLFTTISELSNLAEAILQQAYRIIQTNLQYEYGTPKTENYKEAGFAIIGMGKLGGRELNYNSDLDLIFVYDREGTTTDGMPNREYFKQFCQQLVSQMKEQDENEIVYDVDLRLCPYGEEGPIALSLQDYQNYYDKHGQTWERQALVKARPVAGNIEIGWEFIQIAHDFVYKEPLTSVEVSEIIQAREQKENKVKEENRDVADVKMGHGGIVDIEFAVQTLQLFYGVEMPQLRCTNTISAIEKLREAKVITSWQHEQLLEAYEFLRKVENRLHIVHDEPLHVLPTQESKLEKLAKLLGYSDSETSADSQFMQDYRRYTNNTRELFNSLLERDFDYFQFDNIELF